QFLRFVVHASLVLLRLPNPNHRFFASCRAAARYRHLFPYTTLFRSAAGRRGGPTEATRCAAQPSSATPSRVAHRVAQASGETGRSEEHTSELQSRRDLVCRLLLEKKNKHGI